MSAQHEVGLSFLFDTAYRFQSDFQRYVSNYTQFLKHENPNMDEAQMTMAQQTLRVEFYRLCLESLGLASFDGLLITDYQGTLLEINAMAERTLGIKRDEMLGQPAFEKLFPGNQREEYLEWIKTNAPKADGFRKSTEVLMVKDNGTIFPAELKVTELNIFGSALLVVCFNDVTRRKWMDQALKYTEERYRKIMGENADAICLVDPYNKRIEESNTSFNIMLGYSDDELFALRLYDVLEGEPENIDSWVDKSLQRGTSFLNREQGRFKTRNQHFVDVEYSCSVFDLRDHPILCIIARDTAPREYTVRHALVDDQITAIEKKLEKIEERIGELGQTRLSRVQQEILDEMQEFHTALKADINPETEDKSGLALSPTKQPFELKALIYQVQSFFEVELQRKGVELMTTIAEDVPDVMIGDALKVQEVLYHIMENAVSHTESGNILVNARLKNVNKMDAGLLFTIRDSGNGIPKVTKAKISDVITDVDPLVTGKKYGVRGIAISAKYVQFLGGEMRFNTVEGKGTSFLIELPISLTEQPPEDLPELTRELLNEHLMLVSDEEAREALKADANLDETDAFTMVEETEEEKAKAKAEAKAAALARAKAEAEAAQAEAPAPAQTDAPSESDASPEPAPAAEMDMSQPLRLLLVENDVDNALALQRFIANQAIEMRMVDNGRKALELVEEQSFDLIIMSLQAPIMSGQAAAAAIRMTEQQNRTRPLYMAALDSEGSYEENEDTLRDFDVLVTSPLQKDVVENVLLQARARAQNVEIAAPAPAAPARTATAPAPAAAPDKAQAEVPMDILDALSPSAPAKPASPPLEKKATDRIPVVISSDMANLAPDFLSKRRQDVDKLYRALDEDKLDSVRVLGKSMKGTGAIYGFERIADLGKQMEQAAVDKSADTARQLTSQLADFLERVELVIE